MFGSTSFRTLGPARRGRSSRRQETRNARSRSGSVLIGALAFTVVFAFVITGVATCTISHYSRATTEASYASAIDLADAGFNYELRKISQDPTQADQISAAHPSGMTYNFAGGSFTVYCANADGSTPWTNSTDTGTGYHYLYIVSTGTVNGVSRTIKAMAQGAPTNSNINVYAVSSGSFAGNTVVSNVGTNGSLNVQGSSIIQGTVSFNGPSANWASGSLVAGSPITHNAGAIPWFTVDQLVDQTFPNGGWSYLAAHNDNNLVPSIVNNQLSVTAGTVVTFVGKPGGANYYLTSMSFTGQSTAVFNNTNGPINVWCGPSGGTGTFTLAGGTTSVLASADPTKEVRIYVATTTGITLTGGSTADVGFYAYNKDSSGNPYGTVNMAGGAILNGACIANTLNLSGGAQITAASNYFSNAGVNYFGFANSYREQNAM